MVAYIFESFMKHIMLLLVISILSGCGFVSTGGRSATDSGVQRENKYCAEFKWMMPIEHVDAATNGKQSGGGHFEAFDGSFMTHDYEIFATAVEAKNELEKRSKAADYVLRSIQLKDGNGDEVGEKTVVKIVNESLFKLYWTNGTKLNIITGENEAAIAYVESLCHF